MNDDNNNNYNGEDYKIRVNSINKVKVISNALTIALALVITGVVFMCMYTVSKPIFSKDTSVNVNINGSKNSEYLNAMNETLDMINEKYIDIYNVDKEEMLDNILAGIASSVDDPYTRYITDEEYNEMLTSGTEEYTGIGIHLTYDTEMDAIIIMSVMPGSPAQEAGLEIGDYILKVEDTVVNLESYYDCVDIMKGKEGTDVKIVIYRDGKQIEKTVTRKKIHVNNVESEILDGNIGYIKILQFDNGIYDQFKEQYNSLLSKNVKGLIIDVRNNPGGLVSDTIKILDLLLPKGEVLRLTYKDGRNKIYKCSDNNQIKIPLAILTNGSSASASEILASAVKDAKKGVLIGTKTYGKGIVQEVEKLDTRGALSITVAKYYTSSGIEINKNGIEPDIVVELPKELKKQSVVTKDKDLQLQRAIKYINENK